MYGGADRGCNRTDRQGREQVRRPRRRERSAGSPAPPQGAPVAGGVVSGSPALPTGDRAGGRLAAAAPTWLRWWSRWGWSGVSAPGGPAHPAVARVLDPRPRPSPGKGRAGVGGAGRRESRG